MYIKANQALQKTVRMEMEAIIMGLHRYTDQRKILLSAKAIDIRKNNHVSDDQREIKRGTRMLESPNTQNRHKCSSKATAIQTPKRKGKANHEAEGEGADDGEREIATADSSTSPMCPTKMLVNELVPYWQRMLNAIGAAIFHILTVSIQNTALASRKLLTGA